MIIHDNEPLLIFYKKTDATIKKSEIEEFDFLKLKYNQE